MGDIFKIPVRFRKAAQRGKELTIPPGAQFEPGDEAIMHYDGFILIVPKGTEVNEKELRHALGISEEIEKSK